MEDPAPSSPAEMENLPRGENKLEINKELLALTQLLCYRGRLRPHSTPKCVAPADS